MHNLTPEQLASLVGEEAATELQSPVSVPTADLPSLLGGLGLGEVVAEGLPSDIENKTNKDSGEVMEWSVAEASYRRITEMFHYLALNIKVPSREEFVSAGVNFEELQKGYEGYEAAGMKPELVFAPVNLSLHLWRSTYSALSDYQGKTYPYSDFVLNFGALYDTPLFVESAISREWDELNRQALENTPGTVITSSDGIAWKALVVPTGDIVTGDLLTLTSHDLTRVSPVFDRQVETFGLSDLNGSFISEQNVKFAHMPIGTYLTLQAQGIFKDQHPLDSRNCTWVAGVFGADRLSPWAKWSYPSNVVLVSYDSTSTWYNDIGVRLPIWG